MVLGRKHFWQMLALTAAGLLLGLGRNFFAVKPLPLLRSLPASDTTANAVPFGEVDADFILQIGSGSGMVLLDARAAAAYRLGHIPGALSLPVGEFSAEFPRLEPGLRQARLLVLYCSGKSCDDSRDLAGRLWAQGLKNLLLYRGGMEDWSGNGRDVER
jgi:rhodanese-related sulfurtransferase